MGWEKPPTDSAQHRRDLKRAARILRAMPQVGGAERESAVAIINQWRLSHNFPLNTFQATLRKFASSVDRSGAYVLQRIKRFDTIENKLIRYPHMELHNMQDVGGCRAIMQDMSGVMQLVSRYRSFASKPSKFRHELRKPYDYFQHPKADGYRSYHLVYEYRTANAKQKAWEGLQIEIQLRTRLQHAWAAAVETVDLFEGQRLKFGDGDPNWKRLFVLMGAYLAHRDGCPLGEGVEPDPRAIATEIAKVEEKLGALQRMSIWSLAHGHIFSQERQARYYVLVADLHLRQVLIYPFGDVGGRRKSQLETAREAAKVLVEQEKTKADPNRAVVMVGAKSIREVEAGFPSYIANTDVFARELRSALALAGATAG